MLINWYRFSSPVSFYPLAGSIASASGILAALLAQCREFPTKVERGEAKLGEKKVDILPPDPIGELGSGCEKVQRDKGLSLPVVK